MWGGMRASGPDRIRIRCVCRVVFPLSPHGVMFVIIAPKIPHFIVFRAGRVAEIEYGCSATTCKGLKGEGRASDSRGLRRGYALLDLGLRKTHLFEVPSRLMRYHIRRIGRVRQVGRRE